MFLNKVFLLYVGKTIKNHKHFTKSSEKDTLFLKRPPENSQNGGENCHLIVFALNKNKTRPLGNLKLPYTCNREFKIIINYLKEQSMNTYSFRKDLISVQEELLRFAYKLTADKEEANDLLQETSLKALDNEDKYMPDTNFKGWMYTIMRNIFINNYRRIVREQTFVDQTDNLYHLNLPQNSGFASAEGTYDLKEMHRIVNSLPRDYKVPFSMHVSGFKYREIADRLGLPLGTVKSRIFFTRQRLQQELKDFV